MRRFLQKKYITWFLVDFVVIASLLYVIAFIPGLITVWSGIQNPLSVTWSMLQNPYQFHTNGTLFFTGLIALLGALNLTFISYIQKNSITKTPRGKSKTSLSFFSFVFATLGLGCFACGTLIMSSLLAYVGLGGVLLLLPFAGEELLYIGVIFLAITAYSLYKRAVNPLVCPIE